VKLDSLTPIAIMPGRNPLGLAVPQGIDPNIEARVAKFYQEHGVLPAILLVPRELRPGEAQSWSAYLALGEDLPGLPGCPGSAPVPLVPKAQEPVTKINQQRDRGRPRKTVPGEVLEAQGSLREKARRAGVSHATIARRLAAHRQGRGS
jgi:hypothetical protein